MDRASVREGCVFAAHREAPRRDPYHSFRRSPRRRHSAYYGRLDGPFVFAAGRLRGGHSSRELFLRCITTGLTANRGRLHNRNRRSSNRVFILLHHSSQYSDDSECRHQDRNTPCNPKPGNHGRLRRSSQLSTSRICSINTSNVAISSSRSTSDRVAGLGVPNRLLPRRRRMALASSALPTLRPISWPSARPISWPFKSPISSPSSRIAW